MPVLDSTLNDERIQVRARTSSGLSKKAFSRTRVETESDKQSSSRYPEVKGDKTMTWVAFGIAVAAHAVFFFGFSGKKSAAPVASVGQTTEVVLFDVPPVPEEELLADSAALDGAKSEASAGVDVPSLPDMPTTVNMNDFMQPVQMANLLPRANVSGASLSQIPANFRSGGGGGSGNGLGNLFNISDLDHAPSPIYRPLPGIPQHLRKVSAGVSVTVQFVVSAKGEVLDAQVVSSTDGNFDDVAIAAVKKWKFKPGYRQGRTVNVSMSQAIDFKVSGS